MQIIIPQPCRLCSIISSLTTSACSYWRLLSNCKPVLRTMTCSAASPNESKAHALTPTPLSTVSSLCGVRSTRENFQQSWASGSNESAGDVQLESASSKGLGPPANDQHRDIRHHSSFSGAAPRGISCCVDFQCSSCVCIRTSAPFSPCKTKGSLGPIRALVEIHYFKGILIHNWIYLRNQAI